MTPNTAPTEALPPLHKAPHEALQDALFVYAAGSDGAGADLIRGWPALVERVVSDVAGGPWDELLCDLDDWSMGGDNIPYHYSVNFEDGYMAIYRVHDDRAADRATSRAGDAAAAAAADGVWVSRELIRFLEGAAPLNGTWFGDALPDTVGRYWWRKLLRAAPQPTRVDKGEQ